MATISVVIPAFNAQATIDACLDALVRQTAPREDCEVIVVDDGSRDGTADVVRRHPVTLLRQANQGAAAARNHGVRAASGEIVLFTDADCVAAADWVTEMVRPFQRSEIAGVKGVYRSRQRELAARFIQVEYEHKYERMRRQRYVDFVDTYSAGFRREVFLTNGGFDTSFPAASVEDQEFSFRLAKAGYKLVFQPTAAVYHRHQPTLRRYLRRKFLVAYWKVRVLAKHPDKMGGDSHTPLSLRAQILLTYALIGCLLGAPIFPQLLVGAGVSLVMFLGSTLPFVAFALRRDRMVALAAPPLLFLRALAFCGGLIAGTLRGVGRRA